METSETIFKKLESCNFRVSTDTRKDLSGTIYFALKGENFDGNKFAKEALLKGALGVVTEDEDITENNAYVVDDVLKTLQNVANKYRNTFDIPLVAIGGSNGKTTSKELTRDVLKTKYRTHTTTGSLNNHIGVPLSILSMPKDTEIGVFEIGANHPKEHLDLLQILQPTHVVVTNNGMDHLEGFGSPEGARKGNAEIYEWAKENNAKVFVNKNYPDLIEDSIGTEQILYPDIKLQITNNNPLTFIFEHKTFTTQMAGDYNILNIEMATSIGTHFETEITKALEAVCEYAPSGKRSQFVTKNEIDFVVDCYNANPTSMLLSLQSFTGKNKEKKGVILGDMLELGDYAEIEHEKIVEYVLSQNLPYSIFVGDNFKKALVDIPGKFIWFSNSEEMSKWFWEQNPKGLSFLLKGSRGIKIEKVIE